MFVEYLILGIYFAILLSLGFVFSKFNTNLSDFVRGGAQGTWWLVGSSMLMAGISAFTFTGNASAAFDAGPSLLTIYAANCGAFLICALFLGAWFRQTRAYTMIDIVRTRFGVSSEQFAGVASVLMGPIAAAIQLWALAVFTTSVFKFPLAATIVVIGLIVLFYSTTGGRWAVMATDFVQSLILFTITILVAVLSLIKIGGIGEFLSYFSDPEFSEDFKFIKDAGQYESNRFTLKWIIVIFFMQIYAQISINNSYRFLAVKDGREASRASWFAFWLMALGALIWFTPPMVARFLYGSEIMALDIDNPSNASYAFMAMKVLPNGLLGVMIAAMFASTMSSMDTGINNQVGVIVRNIMPWVRARFGMAEMAPGRELAWCKVVTVILGLAIINIALNMAAQDEFILFDAYLLVGSIIGVPLGFPLFAGVFIRRMPKYSYFVIFMTCLLPSLYSIWDERVNGNVWTIQDRLVWIFLAGIAATVICRLLWRFTKEAERKSIHEFFDTMRTPVDYAKEVGKSLDYKQLFFLGNTASAVGAALFLLLLVPNDWAGRLGVAFVAGLILALGLLMRWGAAVEKRKNPPEETGAGAAQ